MNAKRAFRSYRGPDDHMPFMAAISAMSFHCQNMKNFTPDGVFWLTRHFPYGTVTVLRSGDVDYIWTKIKAIDIILAQAADSPYVYMSDLGSNLFMKIDPREDGNYSSWYDQVSAASGGVENATTVIHGDDYGFDLMMDTYGPQAFIWNTQRFLFNGSLDFNVAFAYDFGWDFVNNIRTSWHSYGASYTFTRKVGAVYKVLGVVNYWFGRDPTWSPGVAENTVLRIIEIDTGGVHVVANLSIATPLEFNPENPTKVIGPEYFNTWGSCAMEDEFFYVQRYMRKINWTGPRQLILYKVDYDGNILAESAQVNFPLNTDGISPPGWGDTFNADGSIGILRSNDTYVIHLSGFGQYIRVWDKDLNFIKNIEIPIGMHYSTSATRRKMCHAFGFIKNILYVNTFAYIDPDFEEPGDQTWHTVYMYDISADPGKEFLGTFDLFTENNVVYDGGIMVEGYKLGQ